MTTTLRPPTRRLPRCPDSLEIGTPVVVARPIHRHPNNPPGRRGVVVSTLVKQWPAARPDDPPRQADRMQVVLRMDEPRWPGEVTWKWADELDVIEARTGE